MQKTPERNHEETTGLIQDTFYTNPPGTIQISRVTNDERHELISFENVPEIMNFYTQRGVKPGITQPTNAISIRVLVRELTKQADALREIGLSEGFILAEHADRLQQAVATLEKTDGLLCSYLLDAPVTM